MVPARQGWQDVTKRHHRKASGLGDVIAQGLASCGPGKAQAASDSKEATEGRRLRAKRIQGRFVALSADDLSTLRTLTRSQMLVLLALRLHAHSDTGECWPSMDRLCSMTGLGDRIVRMARADLARLGLICMTRRAGKNSVYKINSSAAAAEGKCPREDLGIPGSQDPPNPDLGIRETGSGDPEGRIWGSATKRHGEDLGIPQNRTDLRTDQGTEGRTRDLKNARPPSGEEKTGQAQHSDPGHGGMYQPYVADIVPQRSAQQAAGARRLARAVATLELLRVPVDTLALLNAEYLSTLSAADYTKALREAEKNRSTLPLTGPAPSGTERGGG